MYARRYIAPVTVAFLTLALSGCISIRSSNEATTSQSTSPMESITASPLDKIPSGTASGTATIPKSPAGSDSFTGAYEQIASHATERNCGKDLVIADSGQTLNLTGDCSVVTVAGTGNILIAQSIVSLEISGTGNIVAVESLEDLVVSGLANTVGWKEGNPKVKDQGANNLLAPDALQGIDLTF